MTSHAAIALDQPLPAGMRTAGNGWWARYRHYPVFSPRWLLGRSLRFGLCIAAFASLVGVSMTLTTHSTMSGAMVALHFAAAFLAMVLAGPVLATLARKRRWPLPVERMAVVAGIALGVVTSYLADQWSSAYILHAIHPVAPALPVHPRFSAQLANLAIRVFIYALLGGGVAAFALADEHRRWRDWQQSRELETQREQRRQAEWRLGLLQAQVEPHFLFNTLASIRAMVGSRPADAEHAIDTLVDYLRGTIPRLREAGEGVASTLGQQLALCRDYLELMRLRSGGRLEYAVEAAPGLADRPFPPLLLLTLVENAIKHGVEPRPGRGMVRVLADRDAMGRLHVRVQDYGLGLRRASGPGIGLRNLREQLQARYGGGASFSLRSDPTGGTEAVLVVPDEEKA
jgi:signal transduction histidine kinase